jgi:hypothetical protein
LLHILISDRLVHDSDTDDDFITYCLRKHKPGSCFLSCPTNVYNPFFR